MVLRNLGLLTFLGSGSYRLPLSPQGRLSPALLDRSPLVGVQSAH